MMPELGHFAIILALCFALLQFFSAMRLTPSTLRGNPSSKSIATAAALGQFIFLAFAMLCLIISFLNNDMTVLYVREHSHQRLPFLYKIGAAWGGHEGSLLLWCLILSGWTVAFTLFSAKNLAKTIFNHILMTLGLINTGFILFLFATSNPFKRDFPTFPISGNDLTPILQDPGLIFHPPMLYLGYVGFAIPFAFATAALIAGKFDVSWTRACRPWVILPWSFLSCGIVLGSWWAYRELGWGGWWFWDPVENASLLPWLAATALIHTLIVCEKRTAFQGWTLLLAIITFGLSLLGTFLVRSGVLVSVHAFANDPARGLYLLGYLALMMGSAFLLYAYRIKLFYRTHDFSLISRETLLLINSVVFLAAMSTIVIGTLYPIILDALSADKISVGEPYFNAVFLPMMLPLLLLMGLAPHVNWTQQSLKKLSPQLSINFFLSLLMGFTLPPLVGFPFHWLTAMGISVGLWVMFTTLFSAINLWKTPLKLTLRQGGMITAHLGIAVLVVGISVNKSYSDERQVKMLPHETVSLAGYQFTLNHLDEIKGPNYESIIAYFQVGKNLQATQPLSVEQRIYTHDQLLSKTGILVNPWRDLYLALGTSLPDGAWTVRIYYKPFVRWIWFGGGMLVVGGILSLLSSATYRRHKMSEYPHG
jgi:cytochrome c-type biogenesis protein CcmF